MSLFLNFGAIHRLNNESLNYKNIDILKNYISQTWCRSIIIHSFFYSFEQLKVAANNLKKQATKKNEGSLAYVKGGLSTFFEAQDALSGEQVYYFPYFLFWKVQALIFHDSIPPTPSRVVAQYLIKMTNLDGVREVLTFCYSHASQLQHG